MRRGLLLLIPLALLALLVACGSDPPSPTPIVIVVTATPAPVATTAPTETRPPMPTATAPLPTPVPPTNTAVPPTETAVPTETPEPPTAVPTDTPEPTATPVLAIGSTVRVEGWQLTLKKTRSRDKLVYNGFGQYYAPSGRFWLIYLDARNVSATTNNLRDTMQWNLVDDHASVYDELWTIALDTDKPNLAQFILNEGFHPLYAGVTPRALTHTVLLFDVAADAQLESLAFKGQDQDSNAWQLFNLR